MTGGCVGLVGFSLGWFLFNLKIGQSRSISLYYVTMLCVCSSSFVYDFNQTL